MPIFFAFIIILSCGVLLTGCEDMQYRDGNSFGYNKTETPNGTKIWFDENADQDDWYPHYYDDGNLIIYDEWHDQDTPIYAEEPIYMWDLYDGDPFDDDSPPDDYDFYEDWWY